MDPRGRVVARTELFERAAIVEDVALMPGDTFYSARRRLRMGLLRRGSPRHGGHLPTREGADDRTAR